MKREAAQAPVDAEKPGRADAEVFDGLGVAVSCAEPLSHHTWLGIGGAARFFCEPVDVEALARVAQRCRDRGIPLRVLGGGSNVLVPGKGFAGMVVRLSAPAFCTIEIRRPQIVAGAGAKLVHVVTASVQAGLSGIEHLVDVPGTLGGALVGNAGGHGGDIGQRVEDVQVMLPDGSLETRAGATLAFAARWSNLDDCLVLGCRLALDEEPAEPLTKRMQKQWIVGRSLQPDGTRAVAMMFKDPLGATAESLIAQAGARDLRIGDAAVYAPHANYVVAGPHCTSDDVRTLVETVRSRVRDRLGMELTPQIEMW